jgi:SPX domain protein involved in polyphosphate accumulation
MKFGKHLKENVHLPWADKYVSYKELKTILKQLTILAKRSDTANEATIPSYEGSSSVDEGAKPESVASLTDLFFNTVKGDVEKVNQFFTQILDSSEKMLGIIRPNGDGVSNEAERAVQGALTELYLLKQYVALNLSGFRKIVVSL